MRRWIERFSRQDNGSHGGLLQAPPTPTMTFPLPLQDRHGTLPTRPEPPHSRQMPSPVPGVPAGASSPGFRTSRGVEIGPLAGLPADAPNISSEAPGSSSPATDWLARSSCSCESAGMPGLELTGGGLAALPAVSGGDGSGFSVMSFSPVVAADAIPCGSATRWCIRRSIQPYSHFKSCAADNLRA